MNTTHMIPCRHISYRELGIKSLTLVSVSITSNIPIMPHAPRVCRIDCVFSTTWHKIVMQRSLVVYHGISHLSLVFSLGIFHDVPLETSHN